MLIMESTLWDAIEDAYLGSVDESLTQGTFSTCQNCGLHLWVIFTDE